MNIILSAAHCINEFLLINRGMTLIVVRLGEYNRGTYFDCDGKKCTRTIDIPIQKMIPHPSYIHSSIHDIALLRLKHSIKFSDSIRPICLPPVQYQNKNDDSFPLTIVRWGENENGKITNKQKQFFNPF